MKRKSKSRWAGTGGNLLMPSRSIQFDGLFDNFQQALKGDGFGCGEPVGAADELNAVLFQEPPNVEVGYLDRLFFIHMT